MTHQPGGGSDEPLEPPLDPPLPRGDPGSPATEMHMSPLFDSSSKCHQGFKYANL